MDRAQHFKEIDEFLSSQTQQEICSLGKVFRNPRSLGTEFVYKIIIEHMRIAAKIMKNNERNRREIEWYRHFMNRFYRNGVLLSPHFPLVSRAEPCNVCSVTKTYNQRDWINTVVANDCLVLFSELADGDLKSVVSQLKTQNLAVRDMVHQVLTALLCLEEEGIVHNDLHLGNILYYRDDIENAEEDSDSDDSVSSVTSAAQGMDRTWVLWDFGMMVRNGEQDPRDDEVTVANTFVNDWKMTLLPLLRKSFPSSAFIKLISRYTEESSSIRDLIHRMN
jgi:serine/threonine protein kinase